MTKRNIDYVSSGNYFIDKDNHHLIRVSFSQIITNRYTTVVLINTLDIVQYNIERVKCTMYSKTNILNPTFSSSKLF